MNPDDDLGNDDGPPDPLDVVQQPAPAAPEPVEVEEAPSTDSGFEEITEEDLRAAGKVSDIIKAAQRHGLEVGLVADVVADQAVAAAVLADLSQ